MYKLLMYDDDDKVMELETNDFPFVFDVTISIMNAINNYNERNNDRHE